MLQGNKFILKVENLRNFFVIKSKSPTRGTFVEERPILKKYIAGVMEHKNILCLSYRQILKIVSLILVS